WIESPLLARVIAEEFFIELSSDFADDHVFRSTDTLHRLRNLLEELFDFERRQIQAIEAVDRVEIDRDRNDLPVDTRAHAVLIRTPLGKTRKILKNLARVGVENMRAILMN